MALVLIGHTALEETFGDVNDQLLASMITWKLLKPKLDAVSAVGRKFEVGCCAMDDECHAIGHHSSLHGQKDTAANNRIVRVQGGFGNQN